jgi:DNA-binding transcriptional LysR family regulator
MNLKQLEVFVAIAETGSFCRAAEATFITQSTASQHISLLEQELGIRLFDRTPKGAFLTPGGKVLAVHAQRVVSEVRSIRPAIERYKGVEDMSLTVGASNIPGSYMVPEVLPHLQKRFPRLAITVLQGDSSEIVRKIETGEVETGVVGSRFESDQVTFTPFRRDSIVLVAQREYLIPETLTTDDLKKHGFIFREPGSGTRKAVVQALGSVGIEISDLDIRVNLGSNEGCKEWVRCGAGICFLSSLSVRRELQSGEMKELEVKGLQIFRNFHIAFRKGRDVSPAASAFAAVMTEVWGEDEHR